MELPPGATVVPAVSPRDSLGSGLPARIAGASPTCRRRGADMSETGAALALAVLEDLVVLEEYHHRPLPPKTKTAGRLLASRPLAGSNRGGFSVSLTVQGDRRSVTVTDGDRCRDLGGLRGLGRSQRLLQDPEEDRRPE